MVVPKQVRRAIPHASATSSTLTWPNPFAANRSSATSAILSQVVDRRRPTRTELPAPAITDPVAKKPIPSFRHRMPYSGGSGVTSPVNANLKEHPHGAQPEHPGRVCRRVGHRVTGRRGVHRRHVRGLLTVDPSGCWQLHPQVAVRPEPFGALLYHFGTRKLSFPEEPHHPDRRGVARTITPTSARRWPLRGGERCRGSLPARAGRAGGVEHVGAPAI